MKFNKNDRVKLYVKGFLTKEELTFKKTLFCKEHNLQETYVSIISILEPSESIATSIQKSLSNETELKELYDNFLDTEETKVKEIFWKIDSKINIFSDKIEPKKNYKINYIKGNNIRSFGEFMFSFYEYEDLLLINSNPENYGGKSNFFKLFDILLWGKFKKTDEWSKLKDILNYYANINETFYIEGMLNISGQLYFLRRDFKKSRSGSIKHSYQLYQIVEKISADSFLCIDNEECVKMSFKEYNPSMEGYWVCNLLEKQNVDTLKSFEKIIGTIEENHRVSNFNNDNINNLLITSPSSRTRNFYNMFGGEYFSNKKDVAKQLYKKFKDGSKLNVYDPKSIISSIEDMKNKLDELDQALLPMQHDYDESIKKINNFSEKIQAKIQLKKIIDDSIDLNLLTNKETIIENLHDLKVKQKSFKKNEGSLEEYDEKSKLLLKKMFSYRMDENISNKLQLIESQINKIKGNNVNEEIEVKNNVKKIDQLIKEYVSSNTLYQQLEKKIKMYNEKICTKCGQTFDVDVKNDNISKLNQYKNESESLMKRGETLRDLNNKLIIEFENNYKNQILILEKQKNEILTKEEINKKKYEKTCNEKLSKILKEIEGIKKNNDITLKIKELEILLKEAKKNEENLEQHKKNVLFNTGIDEIVNELNKKRNLLQDTVNLLLSDINNVRSEIAINDKNIAMQESMLDQLKKDILIDKAYNIYINAHDKDGLIKHMMMEYVIKINEELKIIMMDLPFTCQILIEGGIVNYYVVKENDIYDNLKNGSGLEICASLLSLNLVHINFSKVNLPNYVRIDEIFGTVAKSNIKHIIKIINQYTSIFEKCFIISHREDIRESFKNNGVLTIKKINNKSIL